MFCSVVKRLCTPEVPPPNIWSPGTVTATGAPLPTSTLKAWELPL